MDCLLTFLPIRGLPNQLGDHAAISTVALSFEEGCALLTSRGPTLRSTLFRVELQNRLNQHRHESSLPQASRLREGSPTLGEWPEHPTEPLLLRKAQQEQ